MKTTVLALTVSILACSATVPAVSQTNAELDAAAARALRRSPVVEVYERSRDSVVNIKATEVVKVHEGDFFDANPASRRVRSKRVSSVGSGFVIHPDGYIITNAHVIEEAIEQRVIFADGREFRARVIASEPSYDLAVLKIDAGTPVPALPLGRSDDLMIGETVIAIGNPLGHQNTVTTGVLSATGRKVDIGRDLILEDLLQTDASINPGNSGGPLLNVLGQLIGVNAAICNDAQGISFAIPVDQLRKMMPRLLDSDLRFAIESGFTVDTLDAARIVTVRPDSPAAQAGLQPGDLLMAIDDESVRSGIDYWFSLIDRHEGDAMRLKYRRGDDEHQAVVTLAKRRMSAVDLAIERLGIEVAVLSPEVIQHLRSGNLTGLTITWVEPNGPADRAGLELRDILLALGPRELASLDDLGETLQSVEEGAVVPVKYIYLDDDEMVSESRDVRVR